MEEEGRDEAQALAAQHGELARLLNSLPPEDWDRATRCEGWTVADVVLHLAQTDEMAVASLEGKMAGFIADRAAGGTAASVDDGAALLVERERGLPPDRLLDRWRSGAALLDKMLRTENGHRRVTWVVGELSVRTLTATRLAEAWIHSGDVADAVGATLTTDDRLKHISRLAWRTLPYAFAREGVELSGPISFELVGPTGDAWSFTPDEPPVTVLRGDAKELCLVAARRVDPAATSLTVEGPDGEAVLRLVRTYA